MLRPQRPIADAVSAHCLAKLTLQHWLKLAFGLLILLYFLTASQWARGLGGSAERVLVIKSERILHLMRDGEPYRSYPISLGTLPGGHKQYSGDGRTPEGLYWLEYKNPTSPFYRSIRISYPNESDRQRARAMGREPGGDIMLHGQPLDSPWPDDVALLFNWTNGCIAVTNTAMEEIWDEVTVGTLIEIRP